MMMEKILTLIIPTYNMEALLDRCLTSLVLEDKQLRRRVEALVIIDGAKDRSSEIAHTYENQYPELFRVIDKENGNYGSCVNRGLKEATGKYVKVLDADDLLDTKALEEYVKALSTIDTDVVVTSGVNVTTSNEVTFEWAFPYKSGCTYPIEELNHVWIHDVTHKTEVLRSIGYKQTEGISYSDEEWVFYPMFAVRDFYALDVRLYKYTIGREGQTMSAANWTRAMGNEIRVSRGMIRYLNSIQWNMGRAASYFQKKMKERMEGFYSRALLTFQMYDSEELKDFDLYLQKECPAIYKNLSSLSTPTSRFRFHFVDYWRKNGYKKGGLLNKFFFYHLWLQLRSMK